MVEKIGLDKDLAVIRDKSWIIWQEYCLLSAERRKLTTYERYEGFMLGAVDRLQDKVPDGTSQKGEGTY